MQLLPIGEDEAWRGVGDGVDKDTRGDFATAFRGELDARVRCGNGCENIDDSEIDLVAVMCCGEGVGVRMMGRDKPRLGSRGGDDGCKVR